MHYKNLELKKQMPEQDLPWSTHVKKLTRVEDLQATTMRPAIVIAYSPECGYSADAQKKIDAFIGRSELKGRIYRYNAVPSTNEAVIQKAHDDFGKAFEGLKLRHYPMIFGFASNGEYKNKKAFQIYEYDGPINQKGLENFYNEALAK